VGTPPGEDGSADLSYVLAAAEEIGRHLERYAVIVNKSTVPVGSAEKVAAAVAQLARAPFDVVSNPEFLKEGSAIDDFMRPDRVVVGVASEPGKGDEMTGANIGRHLARHGVNVEIRRIATREIDVASAILSHVADVSADLLIMGGYGHSRLREFILGGVTRTVLKAMTVPALMSH
jgi:UDP-glucose 6-dehydrogenase